MAYRGLMGRDHLNIIGRYGRIEIALELQGGRSHILEVASHFKVTLSHGLIRVRVPAWLLQLSLIFLLGK